MVQFPLSVPALRVVQPIGVYYVAVIPAEVLLQVSYSDKLTAKWNAERVVVHLPQLRLVGGELGEHAVDVTPAGTWVEGSTRDPDRG